MKPYRERGDNLEHDWRWEMERAFSSDPSTWFTGRLLRLIAVADPFNRERIRLAFPDAVAAFDRYQTGTGEFSAQQD